MKKRNRMSRRHAGFTLMEVLLVMGILLLLGTVSVVAYTKIKASSDRKIAKALVNNVKSAVETYEMQMNGPPAEDQGLSALITAPDDEEESENWKEQGGPFLKDGKLPKDPWGTELVYKYLGDEDNDSGITFRVYSCGKNKEDDSGTGDDIPDWGEDDN